MYKDIYVFDNMDKIKNNIVCSSNFIVGNGVDINTYGFENGRLRVNIDSSTYCYITKKLIGLKVGDIIQVKCGLTKISGVGLSIEIYKSTLNNAGKKCSKLVDTIYSNECLNWIVKEEGDYYASLTYGTTQVGSSYVEDYTITIFSNENRTNKGWIDLTLSEYFENFDTTTNNPLQYKVEGSKVHIRGGIKQLSGGATVPIATLPNEIKPKKRYDSAIICVNNTTKLIPLQLANGVLKLNGTLPDVGTWIAINYIYDLD